MEARLFAHVKSEGFKDKDYLRDWLNGELIERNGWYALKRMYRVSPNSLAFFMAEGTIVGCAVINKGIREITRKERKSKDIPERYTAIIWLDPTNIWAWRSKQDVTLREVRIHFLPGPPLILTANQVLNIFRLVSERW